MFLSNVHHTIVLSLNDVEIVHIVLWKQDKSLDNNSVAEHYKLFYRLNYIV